MNPFVSDDCYLRSKRSVTLEPICLNQNLKSLSDKCFKGFLYKKYLLLPKYPHGSKKDNHNRSSSTC